MSQLENIKALHREEMLKNKDLQLKLEVAETHNKQLNGALEDMYQQGYNLMEQCVDSGFLNDNSIGLPEFQNAITKSRVALHKYWTENQPIKK